MADWSADWLPAGPDPLTTHRVERWWADLLDTTDAVLGTVTGATGGKVGVNGDATIHGGGTLEVVDTGQAIDWLAARVRVWWEVVGAEPWALGTFVCSAPVEKHTDGGRGWSVELLDKLTILAEDEFDGTYSLPAGTVVTDAVRAVIESTGETAVQITASDATLVSDLTWPADATKLRIVNDLLDAIGYFALRCDGLGRYVAAPYQPPSERAVVREFTPGPRAIHLPDFDRDQDLASVPNKVKVVSKGDAETAPFVGVAVNDDPASPFSTVSRGRTIVRTITGVEAVSQEVADTIAERRLASASAATATDAISHAAVPLAPNDVVSFTYDDTTARASVRKWDLALAPGALMKTILQEVSA